MKTIKFLSILLVAFFVSCQAVHINSDYDKSVNFSNYKTYGFYKQGIDKVAISDLDKKRIMRSIEEEMTAKGFSKSETPDLLVNISTKEREQVNVNQFNGGFGGWGYGGFGWNPMFWGGGMNSVSTFAEGTLLIDLIDTNKKELVWQGEGVGHLTQNTNKKDENIKGFVTRIMSQYPPILEKK
jgi:Domain of unknown function (DUF4136)